MYTISQTARRTGLSVAVLRAWERRYGIVAPERTPGGYRLYDEDAIARLRTMRALVDAGWAPSQAAREVEAGGPSIEASVIGARPPFATADVPASATETQSRAGASAFVTAAVSLDERLVETVLDDMFAAGSFERVVDDHVAPALHDLGDAWASGQLSVAGEHMASHAVLRRVAASFEAAGSTSAGPPVLVGLPAGCRHEIAALAVATAIRRRGLPVVYLGPDVPPESWIEAVRSTQARAMVVGVPTATDRTTAIELITMIGASAGRPLVATGGRGAIGASLPGWVIRLPDGVGTAAAALAAALSRSRG